MYAISEILHFGIIEILGFCAFSGNHLIRDVVGTAYAFIKINAESSLSETFGIQIRDLIGRLNGLNGITISNVKSSSTYIMFNKNGRLQQGHIRLVGSKGSITGHPEDIIIVDDPYKGIEDTTPTLLQKKIDWFTTIVEQRVRPSTKVIILHTRWHSNDLTGYLLENESHKYDFISFPAIDEEDNVLWPQYYSLDFYLDKQATIGERMFQALYQQKPLDLTSNFFYTDNIIWETDIDTRYHIASCRSWDMAYTEASNPNSKRADCSILIKYITNRKKFQAYIYN